MLKAVSAGGELYQIGEENQDRKREDDIKRNEKKYPLPFNIQAVEKNVKLREEGQGIENFGKKI